MGAHRRVTPPGGDGGDGHFQDCGAVLRFLQSHGCRLEGSDTAAFAFWVSHFQPSSNDVDAAAAALLLQAAAAGIATDGAAQLQGGRVTLPLLEGAVDTPGLVFAAAPHAAALRSDGVQASPLLRQSQAVALYALYMSWALKQSSGAPLSAPSDAAAAGGGGGGGGGAAPFTPIPQAFLKPLRRGR